MKKIVLLSAIASTMIMAGGDVIPLEEVPMVEEKVDYGEIFGQSRTFYLDRTYTGGIQNNRNNLSTGGHIGYKTPEFNGFSAVIALYGTYGFTLHDKSPSDYYDLGGRGLTSAYYDPSMHGEYFDDYLFIGQAYLNYAFGNTNIKVGRQRLDTPLAGADDARMIPNLFEAAILSNTDVKNTTLIAGHILRESIGTFGHVYTPGQLSLQSGYGLGLAGIGKESGEFINMGTMALGQDANGNDITTDGVTALAAIYKNDNMKLQAWDYIAWDILNAVYLEGDYTMGINTSAKVKLSAQYINESEIGDALAGQVNVNYVAGKITGIYDNFSAYFAYSTTGSDNNTITNGGVVTPWGGMPAYTQGMVTRHQFFANTDAWKVAASYKFTEYGLKASVYYAEFDIGTENTFRPGVAWIADESGFDIQYKVAQVEGLNIRFRGNFPNSFGASNGVEYDWDEYRFIVNYNF